ncbi:Tryptophan 5-hydroxylase [Hondaea fermentalgiana]|uniref:phenylalanine 4-monooxygenase n=1 Tax=Hondaea fermentalgiana TaxID=2315210 RepID=A0A2R5GKQ0_9STRA|nr:Tryptophan 5-hydroxylase [Hondaea fermentalgiana]|eukprot:GBG30889.1 Tryptophan 5-hydroxylase [Hondaea fermentalgiana]
MLMLRGLGSRAAKPRKVVAATRTATRTAGNARGLAWKAEEQRQAQEEAQAEAAARGTASTTLLDDDGSRTSLNLRVKHQSGALETVLRLFWKYDLNLTRIESRPSMFDSSKFEIDIDFQGSADNEAVSAIMNKLQETCEDVRLSDPVEVPWFPTKISDLDFFSQKTLDAGADLESDHPGFSDKVYRERREMIVANAGTYRYGQEIPRVDYSEDEIKTWGTVYRRLKEYFPAYACQEYIDVIDSLEREVGYGEDNIPQQQDVSEFLKASTGFQLRPVAGLLSARDFLNALAFKTFFSTQYIRHHSMPLYTPEPDVVHELMGHAPLLANPDFAELSQTYGIASLGASDRDITRLATCYWFTIEFGLYRQGEDVKAYGAGLLSSFGELEYACGPKQPGDEAPELLPWDPTVAADTEYPITTYQPKYFVADSLQDATDRLKDFGERQIVRPFRVSYIPEEKRVQCDRNVSRVRYNPDV